MLDADVLGGLQPVRVPVDNDYRGCPARGASWAIIRPIVPAP